MCSRYYIDPDMMEEISRVVQNIDGRIWLAQGDTRPTDVAPVIGQSEHGLELGICRWGYPLSKGKNPVINARVETVMDKPSFQNGILYHRLLIPAGGFYEWNSLKEKSSFARPDSSVLYMAGFCDWFENERRFVILTTTANNSMKKIHDRMSSHVDSFHNFLHLYIVILAVSGYTKVYIDLGAEHASDTFRIKAGMFFICTDGNFSFCDKLHQFFNRHMFFFCYSFDFRSQNSFSGSVHLGCVISHVVLPPILFV